MNCFPQMKSQESQLMKFRHFGAWPLVCIISGLVGYWVGHPRQEIPGHMTQEAARSHKSQPSQEARKAGRPFGTADSLVTPELRDILGNAPLSGSSIRQVTMHILEENDPVRRLTAIGLILDSMTPANASAIRQAFIDITAETGRTHEAEWHLMVRKFGVTLGRAALDEIKNNPGEKALAFEGWAMADPDGAMGYFRTLDPQSPEYAKQCMSMLAGVAKTDPEKGFLLVLSESNLPVDAEALVKSAIQSKGMDGVTHALQNALDQVDPDAAQKPSFNAIFRKLADSMIFQNWTSGRSENVLPWLEQHKGQPFLDNNVANHATKNVALQGKITTALDWLDRMNDGDKDAHLGREGIGMAVMENPSILTQVDEATLDRVIAQFPPKSDILKYLADDLESLKPEYATRLRAAGQ